MGNLTDFYLIGHSFGGYHVGLYACKYPQHIKKLILASPIGVKVPIPIEDLPKATSFGYKMFRKVFRYGMEKHISPFAAMRTMGKTLAL